MEFLNDYYTCDSCGTTFNDVYMPSAVCASCKQTICFFCSERNYGYTYCARCAGHYNRTVDPQGFYRSKYKPVFKKKSITQKTNAV